MSDRLNYNTLAPAAMKALQAIDAAGIRNFHLVVHDIGGLLVLTSSGGFPVELSRSRFSIRSSTSANSDARGSWSLLPGRSSGGSGYNRRELRCFMFSSRLMARATSTGRRPMPTASCSCDQIADERSSRSCGASIGPPPLSTASRPLCRSENSRPRSFGARMIEL